MGKPKPSVVVAARDAQDGPVIDDLIALLEVLAARGATPLLLLVGDGERLADLRALARVVVIDKFRRRRLAGVATLVGARRLASGLKGRRLRRWVRSHTSLPWIVHHPTAASALRYTTSPPARLVAVLPEPGMTRHNISPTDGEVLRSARLWITSMPDPMAAAPPGWPESPVLVGSIRPVAPAGPVPVPELWPVILVPTPGEWHAVNHTAEVVQHLGRNHPDVPVSWVVNAGEDRWLAAYDIERLGASHVKFIGPAEVAGHPARAVVRTGYGPCGHVTLELATAPVIGLDLSDEHPDWHCGGPLQVPTLLARLDEVLHADHELAMRQHDEQASLDSRRAEERAMRLLDALEIATIPEMADDAERVTNRPGSPTS